MHYTSGGHGTEMFAAHKELPGTIVDWYVQTLVRTPGSAPAVSGASGKTRAPGILEEIDSPGGASTAAQKLAEARRRDLKANLFSEAIVNVIGYGSEASAQPGESSAKARNRDQGRPESLSG